MHNAYAKSWGRVLALSLWLEGPGCDLTCCLILQAYDNAEQGLVRIPVT